jgi:lipopolysaccharide biosynthesis regulator YciM
MAFILVLLFIGGSGTAPLPCRGADLDFNVSDPEEDLPDMNYVKAQAEAGRARSQTQLADFHLALSDFTNAVTWYQKAAEQNHVPAQLSLAGCLLSGRGTERNPSAAASWLRRAADLIEAGKTVTNLARSVTSPALSLPPVTNSLPRVAAPTLPALARTNTAQIKRIEALLAAEPDLLDAPVGLKSPADPR